MASLISNNPKNGKEFPRDLVPLERTLILSQLPERSSIYREYRERIERMKVVGIGKRGAGHLVLCEHQVSADALQLVTPVFALGGAEQGNTDLTIVIHEIEEDFMSVELMALRGSLESFDIEGARLWSVSDWKPGDVCPRCSVRMREIRFPLKGDHEAILAVCPAHRAIWIFDGQMKMNRIIPLTGFMSELGNQRGLRTGKYEYRPPSQTFSELDGFSDSDFIHAFILYNKFWRKLEIGDVDLGPAAKPSFASKLVSKLVRKGGTKGDRN